MVFMLAKKYANVDLEIELTSSIDGKQNVWFRGKDIAQILGYSKTRDKLSKHVDSEDKQQIFTPHAQNVDGGTKWRYMYGHQ